jgi:hypothetical protein
MIETLATRIPGIVAASKVSLFAQCASFPKTLGERTGLPASLRHGENVAHAVDVWTFHI